MPPHISGFGPERDGPGRPMKWTKEARARFQDLDAAQKKDGGSSN